MGYSLEQFSTECRRILEQDPGVEGRKQMCALVPEPIETRKSRSERPAV